MKQILSIAACLVTTTFLTQSALAQGFTPVITGGGSGEADDTRGYVGLSWTFGPKGSSAPDVVVGVQSITVNSDDDLTGVDLNVRFGLQGGLSRIALSGLGGSTDLYANAGVGYDFGLGEPFVTGALQGARLRIGLDYAWASRTYTPYVEVNSLNKPDDVAGGGTLSCTESGYVLATRDQITPISQAFFDVLVSDGLDVDGRLCVPEGALASPD